MGDGHGAVPGADAARDAVLSPAAAWGALLTDLVADPRVPWHAKVLAGAAVAFTTPVTRLLITRRLPWGPVGELAMVFVAVRRLVSAAGYEIVREAWQGDDQAFVWLLLLTGIDD